MQHVNYDAIVIGIGGVGSATLYQLARRGVRVLGIDRFSPGHSHGSSHGETRAIRKAYFEHPDYVPLLTRAYELWRELNHETGQTLFHQTGILEVGPDDGVLLPGVRKAAKQHRLAIEELCAAEVSERFPGFRVPLGSNAIYEPDGGYLLVEDCVKRYVELAKQFGAKVSLGSSVKNWVSVNGEITVRTDSETFVAKNLLITAGAWASDLLGTLGIPLRVLRKHQHWYAPKQDTYRQDRNSPAFFYETVDGCYYGFPTLLSQPEPMVKIAEHTGGEVISDPLACDQAVDPEDQQRIQTFLLQYMPEMTTRSMRHSVCLYTMTDDGHFVVDRHPDFSNVSFTAGLSGHGFKFVPVLGECLADWVEGKATQLATQLWSLSRFPDGNRRNN